MNDALRRELRAVIDDGLAISEDAALQVLKAQTNDLPEIFAATTALRERYFGSKIKLCSIINAKSGNCGEDCSFCAQSAYFQTETESYNLLNKKSLSKAYEDATKYPIKNFSIVTSGGIINGNDLDEICQTVSSCDNGTTQWCASLGCVSDPARIEILKKAGLKRYHHNLEASRSFFPNVCTTHSYDERLETVRVVKRAGLEICCGGLLGLGESMEQRVELAVTMAEEKVDSIPLNFLIPIPGTRLENQPPMTPLEVLKTIAMFRLLNPQAEIRIAAGRAHLPHMQAMIYHAGCNGMMIGDLLTVSNGSVEADLEMIQHLELDPT